MLNEKEVAEQVGYLVIQLWSKSKELEAAKAAIAALQSGGSAAPKE